jgi:hypothetical protein
MFNWSTHQLTEYFSAVNASADEASAIAGAVERAAEMVEAEAGRRRRGSAAVLGTALSLSPERVTHRLVTVPNVGFRVLCTSLGDRYPRED